MNEEMSLRHDIKRMENLIREAQQIGQPLKQIRMYKDLIESRKRSLAQLEARRKRDN